MQARDEHEVVVFARANLVSRQLQAIAGRDGFAGERHEAPFEERGRRALLPAQMRVRHLQDVGEPAKAGGVAAIKGEDCGARHGLSYLAQKTSISPMYLEWVET